MSTPVTQSRVNIVLRTKNRPNFVRRAFADIARQTFDSWVVTVVNDGGNPAELDAVVNGLDDAIRPRVTVIHLAETVGRAAAANQGVHANTDAPYVVLHDDDDTWEPAFLSHTTAWLDERPERAAVAVPTRIIYERIDGERIVETGRRPWLPEMRSISLIDLLQFNRCVPISVVYRRAAIMAVGGFDETVELTEDWDLNVRLLATRHSIDFREGEILANWHQRPGVDGDVGNSVVALAGLHQEYDRMVRDRAVVDYIAGHGLALPLLIGEYTRQLDARLERIERIVGDTPGRMLMRKLRKRLGKDL